MNKKHVVVLMGGVSSEHEVSIASGRGVVQNLDRTKYAVTPVTISLDGTWEFPDKPAMSIFEAVAYLERLAPDCVFIALHGPFGEDGRIQGMLDLLHIAYTSSGCAASALAIDKFCSKAVVRDAGVRVAGHAALEQRAWQCDPDGALARIEAELGFPCVVKSPCQGSSLGMAIPRSAEAFRETIEDIFQFGPLAMVERFISGTEVTCAVLDIQPGHEPTALPLTEIRPVASTFFDYRAKYTPGASQEITPAEIAPEVTAEVQKMAVRAHRVLGCAIWSRNDFIIGKDGPVWLEVNTIPGMTPTSLYPQAAAAVGISYAELVGLFVEAAIERRKN